MKFQGYGLGIDGGGTFTDAVILDFLTGKIIAGSKVLTTPVRPAEGIGSALSGIPNELLSGVRMVSLATTFATNAIVEDRGARAGLVLIGYDSIPIKSWQGKILRVRGGHNVSGERKEPLDEAGLKNELPVFLEDLDAVAVAGFFSVRNPEHEKAAARHIEALSNLPVICGHRLSRRLDANKRAVTAWWNARLIPLIRHLVEDTAQVLQARDIRAPLMVVRGDGTLMSAQTARERAVETLFSGPAASIMGARYLSGLQDALIVDMGGTTTDMAVLKEGRVTVDPRGARVGTWQTNVEAARVHTIGVGGDSLISTGENRKLAVGPHKVIPLCTLGDRYPRVLDLLHQIKDHAEGQSYRLLVPSSIYCSRDGELISEYFSGMGKTGRYSLWDLEKGHQDGVFSRSSLTPTDLCVAAGRYDFGCRRASQLGLSLYAGYLNLEEDRLCRAVEEEISHQLCREAIHIAGQGDEDVLEMLAQYWFKNSGAEDEGAMLKVAIELTAPVVGAGAPAHEFLPRAFSRMGTQCILPKGYEVAVAVGAIVGMVENTFTARIREVTPGRYTLYTRVGKEELPSLEAAVRRGRTVLEELARVRMEQDLVHDPVLTFTVDEKTVKTAHGASLFLEAVLQVRGAGKPGVEKGAAAGTIRNVEMN